MVHEDRLIGHQGPADHPEDREKAGDRDGQQENMHKGILGNALNNVLIREHTLRLFHEIR